MPLRFAAIGDSLTQGFQQGAISRPEWSYPAMVSRALGAAPNLPDFSGEGGLPFNLERLLNELGRRYGSAIQFLEIPFALGTVGGLLSRIEEYWERGPGAGASGSGPLHHSLAVWGFEVLDAYTLTEAVCRRHTPPAKNQLWVQNQIPEYAMYRTARRVLNPRFERAQEDLTQLDAARALAAREGGIENLLVFLGSNNVLGTCTSLRMRWSQSADFRKYAHQRACNIWAPEHFQTLVETLSTKVRALQSDDLVGRVFIGTVPHVTIAPVSRGVSPGSMDASGNSNGLPDKSSDGYYEYYTHFWVWDKDFAADPHAYQFLTREDARTIDQVIDAYNESIRSAAEEHGWTVVDYCRILDELAFRRSGGRPSYRFPDALVRALSANPATAFRVYPDGADGSQRVLLDARYMNIRAGVQADPADFAQMQSKYRGGLFGLDGVHPSTTGYGVMAHELLGAMRAAGVPGADPGALPWDRIVEADTLLTAPPKPLESLQEALGFLSSRGPLARLIRMLSGFGSQEDADA
jgi:hypothetical protein